MCTVLICWVLMGFDYKPNTCTLYQPYLMMPWLLIQTMSINWMHFDECFSIDYILCYLKISPLLRVQYIHALIVTIPMPAAKFLYSCSKLTSSKADPAWSQFALQRWHKPKTKSCDIDDETQGLPSAHFFLGWSVFQHNFLSSSFFLYCIFTCA